MDNEVEENNGNTIPSTSPSQSEVLIFLEKNIKWLTTKEVCKGIKAENRGSVVKFLRQLHKYEFIIRKKNKKVIWGNEYLYKIK